MLYGLDDVGKLKSLLARAETRASGSGVSSARSSRRCSAICETTRCRRQVLLGYFGEERAEPCGNCDVCLEPAESFDGTELARRRRSPRSTAPASASAPAI